MTSSLVESWTERADELRAVATTAPGRFVVSLLGESLGRGRPTLWFGHAPDGPRLRALLASYGEVLDPGPLLAVEVRMRGEDLAVDADAAAAWRDRLDADAAAVRAEGGLGARDPWHLGAASAWLPAAAATTRRSTGLHPEVALSQLRWVPGADRDAPPGYADELGLAATTRSVQEQGFSTHEWEACEAARPWASPAPGTGPDPVRWLRSCVAWAAEQRPWRSAGTP